MHGQKQMDSLHLSKAQRPFESLKIASPVQQDRLPTWLFSEIAETVGCMDMLGGFAPLA